MILTVGVDNEDQPSDWHNAVVQTTNGCCLDLESVVATFDRHVLANMSEEKRLMGWFAEDPKNRRGGLRPPYPQRG